MWHWGEVVELHPIVVAQPHMKRLAGAVKSRSCSRMKLMTYSYGGLGSQSDAGGTIHAGYAPSPAGASSPPFTSSFRASGVTVNQVQGKGSSTTIGEGGAIVGEGRKLGRRRSKNEASKSEVGETRGREEGKKQRSRRLIGEVRDSPFPFCEAKWPRSWKLRAPRALTAGNSIRR
jgi:hypothetical protein